MGKFNKLLATLQSEENQENSTEQTHSHSSNINYKHQLIHRSKIIRDDDQVRKYFDSEKLDSLATTIKEQGILEDLAVFELPDKPGYYQLVFGERRYRASDIAGLEELPVRVIDRPNTRDLLKLQLIENKHHEDLNPVEEVEAVLALLSVELQKSKEEVIALFKQMDNDVRRQSYNVIGQKDSDVVVQICESLNIRWRSFALNQLQLLRLPQDVLEFIRQGKIEYTKALAVAKVKDKKLRTKLLREVSKKNLSIREIRDRVKSIKESKQPSQEVISYKEKWKTISKEVGKSKVWDDSKKRKKLESLIQQIESLIESD